MTHEERQKWIFEMEQKVRFNHIDFLAKKASFENKQRCTFLAVDVLSIALSPLVVTASGVKPIKNSRL